MLQLIPVCGGVIAAVWGIVVNCIGLARAHETDTGRAVLGYPSSGGRLLWLSRSSLCFLWSGPGLQDWVIIPERGALCKLCADHSPWARRIMS